MKKGLMTCITMGMAFILIVGICFIPSHSQGAPAKEIVWAIVDDFSGPSMASGKEGYQATAMFLEERKYTVGPFKVKLVTRDTELKPAIGVRRLQEVIAEYHPMIVLSGCSSAVQLAMADIMGKTKEPILWTEGWDTRLTGKNGNRYTFRWAGPNYTVARSGVSAFLDKFPDIKKVMQIQMDYAWGYDLAKETDAVLKKKGIKNLKTQFIPITSTDCSVFITEAKAADIDAYISGFYGKILGIGLRQIDEFSLKKKVKIFSATATLSMVRGIGTEVLNGMYLANQWDQAMDNEWSRAFVDKYRKRWGIIPSDYAAAKYFTCELMERVIRQTGSADTKKLIVALENLGEFEGPTGKEYMSAWNHQIVHNELLLRGKSPGEKRYEDDYFEVIGGSAIYPKKGEPGFDFDRTKEPL